MAFTCYFVVVRRRDPSKRKGPAFTDMDPTAVHSDISSSETLITIKNEPHDVDDGTCPVDPLLLVKIEPADVYIVKEEPALPKGVCSLYPLDIVKCELAVANEDASTSETSGDTKEGLDIEPILQRPYIAVLSHETEKDANRSQDSRNAHDVCSGEKPHNSIHTHIDKLMYVCDYCNKSFSIRNSLVKHIQIHTDKRLRYETSKIKFTRKCKFIAEKEKSFGCGSCDKTFSYGSHLSRHKLTHTGERPFGCESCDKTFTQSSHLSQHKFIHIAEQLFRCKICDKAFLDRSALSKHKLTHIGERRFNCEICDKTFTRKSNLTRHKLTHPEEWSFRCNFCDKTFALRSNLSRHILKHT